MDTLETTRLNERIHKLQTEINQAAKKSGRKASDITLVAVSKTYEAQLIAEAFTCGITNFGENYVQEVLPKMDHVLTQIAASTRNALNATMSQPAAQAIVEATIPQIHWHFIGHLQSNKVKSIIGKFQYIHSIDSFSTAEEISDRVDKNPDVNEPQKIMLEVNLGNEPSKTGVTLAQLPKLIDEIQELEWVQICGLMAMPPLNWQPEELRREFNHLRDERDRLSTRLSAPHSLVELSMGTSHDFTEAIEAGSTMVRIGTRIFGERN